MQTEGKEADRKTADKNTKSNMGQVFQINKNPPVNPRGFVSIRRNN